jgi:phage I-like protein
MPYKAGYWVDLAGVKFDDSETTWIQAIPLGTYQHPVHGEIEITPERAAAFADSVKLNVRSQDLDIDYDHKEKTGEAAGWVKDAEARADGTWLQVEWTKSALAKLKEKAYRYFSPEFMDEWVHPKTQVKHKDVVFGGALTNRPFLKGIQPINLSEVFEEASTKSTEGGKTVMTEEQRKALAKKFKLSEDATEADILKALETFEVPEPPKVDPPKPDPEPTQLSEDEKAIKKLAESNPLLAKLVEKVEETTKSLSETQAALRLSETNATVHKLEEKANAQNVTIPPAMREELVNALVDAPKKLHETIYKTFESILDGKLVSLKEVGSSRRPGTHTEDSPNAKLMSEVNKLREADKELSFSEAMRQVAAQNPELYEEYRDHSYSGRGNGENE